MNGELSDGETQVVDKYLPDVDKICEEETRSAVNPLLNLDNSAWLLYVTFKHQHLLPQGPCFVSSEFYEQIPQTMSHSIHPFNHTQPPSNPPRELTITPTPCSGAC